MCLCLHGWLSHQNGLPSVAVALGSADCCGGGSCSHAGSCVVIMMAPGKVAGRLMAFLLLWRTSWEEVGLVRTSRVEQARVDGVIRHLLCCLLVASAPAWWLLLLHCFYCRGLPLSWTRLVVLGRRREDGLRLSYSEVVASSALINLCLCLRGSAFMALPSWLCRHGSG